MTSEHLLPGRPRHSRIADLQAACADLDGQQLEAAESLLEELAALESHLATIDYPNARAALERAVAEDEGRDDWPLAPLPQQSLIEDDSLRDVETYKDCAVRLLPTTATLLALDLLRKDCDLPEAHKRLRGEPWLLQHEVLVRLSWMRNDQELLAAGHTRQYPYRCTVADRAESRFRRTDREFHTLLLFGHRLKMTQGREILLDEKREKPDFAVLEVGTGARLGVEVTEAPHSRTWSEQQFFREQARQVIDDVLKDLGLTADIETVANWKSLARRRSALRIVLKRALARAGTPRTPTNLNLQAFGLELSLVPAWAGGPGLRFESSSATGSEEIDRANADLRDSVITAIKKKVAGALPEIRPTLLVCYVAHDYPASVDAVLESIESGDLPAFRSRFDEVSCIWEGGIAEMQPAATTRV